MFAGRLNICTPLGGCETSPDSIHLRTTFVRVHTSARDVPKVMSNYFLHAKWEQQTKESAVVDGTSCYVILECLVTSIACIT